jgi:maltooligosyltrehalose trehalohydrolase
LLAPSPPLLFMGEEFGATTPFLFFCDFGSDLAPRVTEGRRSEFARFSQFSSPEAQSRIPDPGSEETFATSKLNWASLDHPAHHQWLTFYREVLDVRRREIVPRICKIVPGKAECQALDERSVSVDWPFQGGGRLALLCNFSDRQTRIPEGWTQGRILYQEPQNAISGDLLGPCSAVWILNE